MRNANDGVSDHGEVTEAARRPVTSLYVHVPFCRRRCNYCDFYSIAAPDERAVGRWFDTVLYELLRWADEAAVHRVATAPLETIYFGGGTPSFVAPEMIAEIIAAARRRFGLARGAEITMEANPESSCNRQTMRRWRKAGVTRWSLGVQSMDDRCLAEIGRCHTVDDVHRALTYAADAGFEHLSFDVMTGLPGQTTDDIAHILELVARYPIDHVSAYALTIAPGTPMAERRRTCPVCFPDDAVERAMTHALIAGLRARGFEHYEISNFAKPGARSRHNTVYWRADPYMAVGPAASSYAGGVRRTHPASLDRWIEHVHRPDGGPYAAATIDERVDEAAARVETVLLGFRLSDGVSRTRFRARHGVAFDELFSDKLRPMIRRGLVEDDGETVRLTEHGLDFADVVARAIL
jgi:oxygen-independent coproporphyrinogen-3 oxidase